jgi:hypothetical protein
MKRIVFLIVFGIAFTVSSEVSVGLRLSSNLQNYTDQTDAPTVTESSHSTFNLWVGPVLRFKVSPTVEVAPDIGFMAETYADKQVNGITNNSSDNGVYVGCGFYFFLASNSVFKFSLGPRVYGNLWLSRTDMMFGAEVPLNFDFELSGRWSIRASAAVINFWYSYSKPNITSRTEFDYSIISSLMPELSFFITF